MEYVNTSRLGVWRNTPIYASEKVLQHWHKLLSNHQKLVLIELHMYEISEELHGAMYFVWGARVVKRIRAKIRMQRWQKFRKMIWKVAAAYN